VTLRAELSRLSADQFAALILDNEVTTGDFVTIPPLPWSRLTEREGNYAVAEGYPSLLTAEQAKGEMRNWDEVALPAAARGLSALDESIGYVLIGNNAGQGFPLAQSMAPNLIGHRAAIIYGERLPEKREYEKLGYRTFFRRREAVSRLLDLAEEAGKPLMLFFINTIQHNELNYHDP
jgi:hypothetical protein